MRTPEDPVRPGLPMTPREGNLPSTPRESPRRERRAAPRESGAAEIGPERRQVVAPEGQAEAKERLHSARAAARTTVVPLDQERNVCSGPAALGSGSGLPLIVTAEDAAAKRQLVKSPNGSGKKPRTTTGTTNAAPGDDQGLVKSIKAICIASPDIARVQAQGPEGEEEEESKAQSDDDDDNDSDGDKEMSDCDEVSTDEDEPSDGGKPVTDGQITTIIRPEHCGGKNDTAEALGDGLVGLRNLGNTCYMNSVLQALSHCPTFTQFFLDKQHLKQVNRKNTKAKGELVECYGELVGKLWARNPRQKALKPVKLKRVIGVVSSMFEGNLQHDAQEFLRFFLDGLHEELNRVRVKVPYEEIVDVENEKLHDTAKRWWAYYEKRNDSHVKDLFAGQLYSSVECDECGSKSTAFDPMLDFSVPIPSGVRPEGVALADCFGAFASKEKLEEYYCRACKAHKPSQRTFRVYRPPPILVVHLKRFQQEGARRSKLKTRVRLPIAETFDLAPYCFADTTAQYKLCAVVHHMGSLSSGHYVAHARSRGDQWHCFDDDVVTKAKAADIDPSSAYVLFLQRCDDKVDPALSAKGTQGKSNL